MTADWSQVTVEHVRKACELYDTGSVVPKRPAKSTFLIQNGKTYPGKFIRGLAYRLATGVELDPSRDFSGGDETIRFFASLGLTTQHEPSTTAAVRPAPDPPPSKFEVRGLPQRRTGGRIRKIALVTHNYNVPGPGELYDYSEHFARINKLCDEQCCDTILYALWTWNQTSTVPRNHAAIFGGLVTVQRIVLEVWQPPENPDHVEVWRRDVAEPLVATQRFATSKSTAVKRQAFLNELEQRKIDDALLVICGETNIASLVRGSEEFSDPHQFASRLGEMKVRLIFNPIHDYMTRYEMRRKRRHYSLGGRTVISVWNQGKGKESKLPWTVFHDGKERTDAVLELPRPFADRPDIRIGLLDLAAMEAALVGG